MALEITFDVGPLSEAIGGMIGKIAHFKRVGIGQGMSEFQVEDLGRDKPFTMRSRGAGTAATKIRPHSLYEMKRSAIAQRRVRRYATPTKSGRKRRRPISGLQVKTSARPILREEMYQAFRNRMVQIFRERISWGGKD